MEIVSSIQDRILNYHPLKKINMYLAGGAPKKHMHEEHGVKLTRETVVNNKKIINKKTLSEK